MKDKPLASLGRQKLVRIFVRESQHTVVCSLKSCLRHVRWNSDIAESHNDSTPLQDVNSSSVVPCFHKMHGPIDRLHDTLGDRGCIVKTFLLKHLVYVIQNEDIWVKENDVVLIIPLISELLQKSIPAHSISASKLVAKCSSEVD